MVQQRGKARTDDRAAVLAAIHRVTYDTCVGRTAFEYSMAGLEQEVLDIFEKPVKEKEELT